MKHLILIFCVGLQLLLVTSAQAWSPLAWSSVDINRSFSGVTEQCQLVIADSDDGEGTNNEEDSEEEEEEEPDCD
jgi:hypothetical protein